jgi:hypothetical protein
MKNNIYLVLFLLFIVSCKKEDTLNVSTIVDVSFPLITLHGNPADTIIFVPLGGTYSESGATLTDDITQAQSTLTPESNEVNANTTGVYYVTYRASNANGFESIKKRIVVVYNPAVAEEDYSGNYTHNVGTPAVVSKLASRIFRCDDIYGTFEILIPGYFVDYGDGLYIPEQPIHPSLGNEIHGEGSKSGAPGTYVLDFFGLLRDGLERPRVLTQQ